MVRKSRVDWITVFIESFLIVLSILLALGVNEWRNQERERTQRDRYLDLIEAEIAHNVAELSRVIAYHENLRDTLSILLDVSDVEGQTTRLSTIQVIGGIATKGLNPPGLQRTAWQAAQIANIVGSLSENQVYMLSYLYDLQENGVENTWKSIADEIFETEVFDPDRRDQVLRKLYYQLRELASQEYFLREELRRVQASLEARTAPSDS